MPIGTIGRISGFPASGEGELLPSPFGCGEGGVGVSPTDSATGTAPRVATLSEAETSVAVGANNTRLDKAALAELGTAVVTRVSLDVAADVALDVLLDDELKMFAPGRRSRFRAETRSYCFPRRDRRR